MVQTILTQTREDNRTESIKAPSIVGYFSGPRINQDQGYPSESADPQVSITEQGIGRSGPRITKRKRGPWQPKPTDSMAKEDAKINAHAIDIDTSRLRSRG